MYKPSNRIRELRRARGLSTTALAEAIGTTQATISRLEKSEMALTLAWMQKIAAALDCTVGDLAGTSEIPATSADVVPIPIEDMPEIANGLARRNIVLYSVAGHALDAIGLTPGTVITVDKSITDWAAIKNGDPVVVCNRLDTEPHLALRQFLAPGLLVTNRSGGGNSVISTAHIDLVGLVLR
jgi:transcriptional regulator with XRE-family HTH domain